MKRKFFVFFMLLSSFSVFAQNNLLDGTWTLDSVSVVKISDNSALGIEEAKQNPFFGVFEALAFQGNDLTVTINDYQAIGTAEITNDKIKISFTDAPIEVQYQIKDGQLFLEHHVSFPGEGHPNNNIYIVTIKYKKQ